MLDWISVQVINRYFCVSTLIVVSGFGNAGAVDDNLDGMSDIWQGAYQVPANAGGLDPDGDGFTNVEESIFRSNPGLNGSPVPGVDLFGMPQVELIEGEVQLSWQAVAHVRYQVRVTNDFGVMSDAGGTISTTVDSLVIVAEPVLGSHPRQFFRILPFPPLDLDGDKLDAWEESELGTSDLNVDTDGDEVPDGLEYLNGIDPLVAADADSDGLKDDWERMWYGGLGESGSGDVDEDGLPDAAEHGSGLTSASVADTDGDGANDGYESADGTSPVTNEELNGARTATLLIVH